MAPIQSALQNVKSFLPKPLKEAIPMSRSSSATTVYSVASSTLSTTSAPNAGIKNDTFKSTQSSLNNTIYNPRGNPELAFLGWANSATSAVPESNIRVEQTAKCAAGNPELAFLTWPNSEISSASRNAG